MRLQLRVQQNGFNRELTIEQLIDLGNIPSTGEQVEILMDRQGTTSAMTAHSADSPVQWLPSGGYDGTRLRGLRMFCRGVL